jgi:putative endonuclease
MPKFFFVYIITNQRNTVLYTGVTNNLIKRIYCHKNKSVSSFSSKYNLDKLVYFEVFNDVNGALKREKQIKGGNRKKKMELIIQDNPKWKDLYNSICA